MKYLPASLHVQGQPVTVIGGGDVATHRVETLLACEARVTVIAPRPSDEIIRLAEAGALVLHRRPYRHGDLQGSRLVMAAADDEATNASAWAEARDAGVWINVADEPSRCDFIMPSVLWRGDLSVAVSTSGRSPALAVRLRQRIGRLLGPEYARLLEVLGEVRSRDQERLSDAAERKKRQYRLVDSDLVGLIRHGNDAAVRHRVEELLRTSPGDSGSRPGIVYIVGAGPGDPGLITIRGMECLSSADVVLHDRLISPELLESVAPGAEVIDVGKRAGDQGRMQRFIEETMIRRARRGDTVCRLKGGDPFVFGRGGEEARTLTSASVAYEIVPGVTSATAAPSAAGIPVTHRDIAHAFLVMTGSRAQEASPREWEGASELLKSGGTLVVLMGLTHLASIVSRLRVAGCPAEMPAAVISRGTLPDQEVRTGLLGNIASGRVPASPGVIVFGEVVAERQRLEALGQTVGLDVTTGSGSNLRKSPE